MNPSATNFFISIAKGEKQCSQKDINDALRWACLHGNIDILDNLIQQGADVNSHDEFGASVLHFAIKGEKQQVILRLLECNIRYKDWHQGGETLLLLACRYQFLNVVRKLIQLDPECIYTEVDNVGRKALHIACLSESYSIIELMINQPNFDVNQLDQNGWTALHYVCSTKSSNQCNLMHLLFMHNADPLIEAPNGKTALEMASESGVIKHIIDILPVKRIMEILIKFDSVIEQTEIPRESQLLTSQSVSNLAETSTDSKSMEEILLMYWKRIIFSEDIELLYSLVETRLWCLEIEERNPRKSVSIESKMKTLFEECYENGLGIHTYVRVHFEDEISQEDFRSILLELSGLEDFSSLHYESCVLFENVGESMVLLALLCGRLNLVRHLLIMRQFDIIPLGLIVTLICRRLENESHFPKQVKHKLDCFSDVTESIVVDALNNTFIMDTSNCKSASLNILDLPLKSFGKMSILDLADKAQCNRVLSLACCQIVVDKRWYGMLAFMSMRWRLIAITMPLLVLFYQICVSQKKIISHDVFVSGRKRRRLTYSTLQRSREDYSEYYNSRGIQPIKNLLKSPAVIFQYHSLFQLIFLILFSYILIYDFHFQIAIPEYVCYSYIIGYAMEELSQCVRVSEHHTFGRYIRDSRNVLDLIFLILMTIGIVMRLFCINKPYQSKKLEAHDDLLYFSRAVLLSGLLVFYFRALFLLSIYKVLGPKLKMIYSMIKNDLIPFMALFVLFLISFGVVFEGLQNPNNLQYNSTIESVLAIYSTGIYGMFSPDYTSELVMDCAIKGEGCAHQLGSQLVFYFYNIIYVMVVDIMLLNLLIALFSNTVSRIDQESTTNWFADRYKMVEEYRGRSILPPPFNILCILWKIILLLCKTLFKFVARRNKNSPSSGRENSILFFFIMQAFALKGKRSALGSGSESSVHKDHMHSEPRQVLNAESLTAKVDELNEIVNKLLECTADRRDSTKQRLSRRRGSTANRVSVRKRTVYNTQKSLPPVFTSGGNCEGEFIPLHRIEDETKE